MFWGAKSTLMIITEWITWSTKKNILTLAFKLEMFFLMLQFKKLNYNFNGHVNLS